MALDESGGSWIGTTPVLGPLQGPPVPPMPPMSTAQAMFDFFTPWWAKKNKVDLQGVVQGVFVPGGISLPPNEPASGGVPGWLIGAGALLGGIVVLQLLLGRRR